MIDDRTLNLVGQAISDVASLVNRVQGAVLTEDDLKCQLFRRLHTLANLDQDYPSADPDILATPIHVEVPWFDEESHLRLRPDITLTDRVN